MSVQLSELQMTGRVKKEYGLDDKALSFPRVSFSNFSLSPLFFVSIFSLVM